MTTMVSRVEPDTGVRAPSTGERSVWDYVPRVTQTFLLQPEGYRAWKARGESIPPATDRRWKKLATVAAAAASRALHSVPRRRRPVASVEPWTLEPDIGSLDATDLAVVLFAAKVAAHTDRITETDVAALRALGLSDGQVFDIALAAAASCFFADAADHSAAS